LFLLPGGLPRRFNADIQAGGRPRRFPRPLAKRSKVMIASSTCSRSCRSSASIFKTSMGVPLLAFFFRFASLTLFRKTEHSTPVRSQADLKILTKIVEDFKILFGKRNEI
jgi:hypothetical protein